MIILNAYVHSNQEGYQLDIVRYRLEVPNEDEDLIKELGNISAALRLGSLEETIEIMHECYNSKEVRESLKKVLFSTWYKDKIAPRLVWRSE